MMMSGIRMLSVLCVVVCVMAEEYRLPPTTVPRHYTINLNLDPSPSSDTFLGHVSIMSDVKAVTSSIVIHQYLLNIDEISVTSGGQDLYSSHQVAENDTHFLTIHLKQHVEPGESVNIDITYSGLIKTRFRGLFRDSYKKPNGQERYLLATHNQPIAARDMFPCYDEPALKAIFVMHVTCPSEYHALFNTPVSSIVEIPASSETKYSFKETPPMSSYLVTVVVSDLEYLSNADNPVYRKEFRSYTKAHDLELLKYSMDIGQRLLTALEDYIGYPYDMEKIDNVAIPTFFSAMENWGLVLYGDKFLLEERSSNGLITNKRVMTHLMCHEFAHQWFGNEVTPHWWEYVWLSEGFAAYFHSYITDKVDPQFGMMDSFVTSTLLDMMHTDSRITTRPMNQPNINSPNRVGTIFNSVVYQKAPSVIRMMSHILREDVMQKSLQLFIASKANSTAVPEDLYEAMQKIINQGGGLRNGAYVADVMGSWVDQAGFPLVTVTRNGDSDYFKINQQRFYRRQIISTGELWWIPLNWATPTSSDYSDTYPSFLMPPVPEVTIEIPDSKPYFVINKQVTGYYRIMYDTQNWEALEKVLNTNPSEIHQLNRAQILDDMEVFCGAGLLPCSSSMNLMQYLANETEIHPWIVAEKIFKRLFVLMENSEEYSKLQKMVLRLNENRLRSLDRDDLHENHELISNKKNSIAVACSAGSKDCLSRGLMNLRSRSPMTSDVRGVELCAGLRGLPQREVFGTWNYLWQQFVTSRHTAMRNEIMEALPCISDEVTLKLFIQRVLGGELDGSQVTSLLRGLISSSPRGADFMLDILKEKQTFYTLKHKIVDPNGLPDLLHTLGDHITTQESYDVLNQVASQWRSDDVLSLTETRAVQEAQEMAWNNIRWMGDQRLQLEVWLRNNIH